MDPPDLTSKTGLDRTWASLAIDAFRDPESRFERLYEMAERDRWSLAEMDWDSIDFSAIPHSLRQRAANMFTQLHYGEVTAMMGAARLVEVAPTVAVQLFSSTQVSDEARHVKWFSTLIHKLDCRGEVRDSVMTFMNDVYECDTIEGLVVGMHVLVEGLAHTFFTEGAQVFSRKNPFTAMLTPYRCASKVIGEWLPEYLGRDESRHIAFGVQFLSQHLPTLSATERDRLEQRVERWGKLIVDAALDPDLLVVPGLDGNALTLRCIQDLNQRLANIGLEARITATQDTRHAC